MSPALDAALTSSGAAAGQFFLNGADTETSGVDVIATWKTEFMNGDLDLTFAANFTETEVTDTYTPPNSALGSISPDDVFSERRE